MQFGHRVAFLTVLAALFAATLAATASPARSATTKAGRLVAFRSCGDLLGYAKSQATRFVGPYGFGRPVAVTGVATGGVAPRAAAPTAAGAAASASGAATEGAKTDT